MKTIQSVILSTLCTAGSLLAQANLTERAIHYRPGDWVSYPIMRFVNSVTLGDEYVYFGTTGGVLPYQFYQKEWHRPFTVSDGMENGNVQYIIFDFNTSFLWCATDAGISFREPASEYWRNISSHNGLESVTDLGVGQQYVWAKTKTGYAQIDRTTGAVWTVTEVEMQTDQVRWSDQKGHGTLGSQYFLEPGYFVTEQGIQDAQFRTYSVTGTVQDQYQNEWFGTWGIGTGHIDLSMLNVTFHQIGPYSPDIRAMAWDADGMWMGGLPDSEGPHSITYWNMNDDTWHYFEAQFLAGLRTDEVSSIAVSDEDVWFGTTNGLAKYNFANEAWRTYSTHDNLWDQEITCLAINESLLYVGSTYGINRVLLNGNIIQKITDSHLQNRMIYQIDVDGEDVWAATDRGIFQYQSKTGQWHAIDGYPGMILYTITAVSVYNDEIWFGASDGIEMYDKKTRKWTGFTTAALPSGGEIHTILPDEKAVWVGTENGVFKYIRNESRWRQFTTSDGLLHNDVHWILLDGDYIWFGTHLGLTKFYWNASYRID